MKFKNSLFLAFSISCSVNSVVHGFECPKKLQAKVTEVDSISPANDTKIDEIFKAGDRQTSKAYIKAVLEVAKNLGEPSDVLTYSRKNSTGYSTCFYKGKDTTLVIKSTSYSEEDGYTATLHLGKIKYKAEDDSNPTEHIGNALDLTTRLRILDKENAVAVKNRKAIISFDLDVQIPLGDYGTDGFTETVEIGKAWVEYAVVE